ncbi:MAG: hypothetical protein IIY55_10180 [Blautia sp.]|nr:hypothetical protein [Blautia sp.]
MILVDIYIASLDLTYDFLLNEEEKISEVLKTVIAVLQKKHKEQPEEKEGTEGTEGKKGKGCKENASGDIFQEQWILCSLENESILSPDRTLKQYGIRDGDRLLLA